MERRRGLDAAPALRLVRAFNVALNSFLSPAWGLPLLGRWGGGRGGDMRLLAALVSEMRSAGVPVPAALRDRRAQLQDALPVAFGVLDDVVRGSGLAGDRVRLTSVAGRRLSSEKLAELHRPDPWLDDLLRILDQRAECFSVVLLDGSVGSGDHMEGWSDLDLFLVVSRAWISDPEGLRVLRSVAARLRTAAYGYQILQLHPPYYCVPMGEGVVLDRYFPRAALGEGLVRVAHPDKTLSWPGLRIDATEYLLTDIIPGLRGLSRHLGQSTPVLRQVLAIHRAFSFPFALLQALGVPCSKKESFRRLGEIERGGSFRGLAACGDRMAECYASWVPCRDQFWRIRRRLARVLDLRLVNRGVLLTESRLRSSIRRLAKHLSDGGVAVDLERLAVEAELAVSGGSERSRADAQRSPQQDGIRRRITE